MRMTRHEAFAGTLDTDEAGQPTINYTPEQAAAQDRFYRDDALIWINRILDGSYIPNEAEKTLLLSVVAKITN